MHFNGYFEDTEGAISTTGRTTKDKWHQEIILGLCEPLSLLLEAMVNTVRDVTATFWAQQKAVASSKSVLQVLANIIQRTACRVTTLARPASLPKTF